MAGYNIVNIRCTLVSIAHFKTLIEKGPSMQNAETIWFLPHRVIGKTNIPLLLQSNYNGFLIHRNYLGEIYAIN